MPQKYKIGCTNYVTARKFFLYEETYEELCETPDYKLEINFSVLKDINSTLKKYDLADWESSIRTCYSLIQQQAKIIPIKTSNGIIRLKIKSNSNNVVDKDEYLDSKEKELDLESFNKYIKI